MADQEIIAAQREIAHRVLELAERRSTPRGAEWEADAVRLAESVIRQEHLEHLESEVRRLSSYHAREPRRFGREGTWDAPLDRAVAALEAARAA